MTLPDNLPSSSTTFARPRSSYPNSMSSVREDLGLQLTWTHRIPLDFSLDVQGPSRGPCAIDRVRIDGSVRVVDAYLDNARRMKGIRAMAIKYSDGGRGGRKPLDNRNKQLLRSSFRTQLLSVKHPNMRQKRAKAYRKLMTLYSISFGFRQPYQVLGGSC